MKILNLMAISVLLLYGCSSVKAPNEELMKLTPAQRAVSGAELKAINDDFQNNLEICDEQMLSLRNSFLGSGKTELTLATIGILAGSVVVPALAAKANAAKSAIAAWGGLSGAANAAQYTIHQKGASAASIGAVYETTRNEIQAATTAFATATDNNAKIAANTKLSVACRFPQLPNVQAPTQTGSGT